MKNVWILETGVIQSNGQFYWHSIEIYTSEAKAMHRISNSIEVNKGYNVQKYGDVLQRGYIFTDYKCISTDDREMDIFLRYRKVKVS